MDQKARDESKRRKILAVEHEQAVDFLQSLRGQWIVGQALTIAARELTTNKPEAEREPSNARDMIYLRDMLFSMYSDVQASLLNASVTAERRKQQDEAGDKQDEADFLRESQGGGR